MELTKMIKYDVKEHVDNVGDLEGQIEISDSFNMTEAASKSPIGLAHERIVIQGFELDYNTIPGLIDYKGKLKGTFLLPREVPVDSTGWSFIKSKEYDDCINTIYKVLEEIVRQEEPVTVA